jgi:hypothetical protein
MKHKRHEKTKKAICGPTQGNWQQMNRKQRREMTRKIQSEDISLEVIHPDAAGIDIGNESHYVAVPPPRDSQPVQRFGCTTAELKDMAGWLKQCGIRTVAMQSTGVYWIAVYDILEEAGLEVYLVNARDTKNLPGHKSDVQESQWLMKLHTYGLLRNSFRPSQDTTKIAALMQAAHQRGIFNGNVLVADGTHIVYERSFGHADSSRAAALSSSNTFYVGSIAKEFKGVGILLLNQRGKLKLTDKISQYLSGYPAWADSIEIRHLLNYTSGLQDVPDGSENAVQQTLSQLKALAFEPGKTYLYSYANVFLQKKIIEKITGVRLANRK